MTLNPKTPTAWARLVRRLIGGDPTEVSIADIAGEKASDLTQDDYLRLRILRDDEKTSLDFKADLLEYVTQTHKDAGKEWAKSPACSDFVKQSKNSNPTYREDNIFSLVTLYQLMTRKGKVDDFRDSPKVIVSPYKTRSHTFRNTATAGPSYTQQMESLNLAGSPRTPITPAEASMLETPQPEGYSPMNALEATTRADEMIVNMALVMLLNALCDPNKAMRKTNHRWLPERDVFKITHPVTGYKILEARTDGCLRSYDGGYSAAIIEVKPYLRSGAEAKIQMQEGAQMAGLIFALEQQDKGKLGLLPCEIPGLKRRVLISQDHVEVYITIAEYGEEYVKYLRRPPSRSRASSASPSGRSTPTPSGRPPLNLGAQLGPGYQQNVAGGVAGSYGSTAPPVGKNSKTTRSRAPAPVPVPAPSPPRATPRKEDFLMMKTYGPWAMNNISDVDHLCGVLVALSLCLSTASKKPKGKPLLGS